MTSSLVNGCLFASVVCEYFIPGVDEFACSVTFGVKCLASIEELKLWLVLFSYIIVLFSVVDLSFDNKVSFSDFVV